MQKDLIMDNVDKTIIGKPVLVDNKKIGVVVDFKEEDGIGIASTHRTYFCPILFERENIKVLQRNTQI